MGYFVIKVLDQIQFLGAYFLSRYRSDVLLFDPQSGQPLDLTRRLRPGQSLDRPVLVGREKLPARLIAWPVPEAVANERRRKVQDNRDRTLAQWMEWHLGHHLFYESRSDRKNFYELLNEVCTA